MNGQPIPKQGKVKGLSLGKWRSKCDKEMQIKGKMLFPKSLISGQPTEVMHHFIPKSVSATLRYNWDNLIPLTTAEHCRLHQSPDPTIEQMIRSKKGDAWWNDLQARKGVIIKVNVGYYKEVYQRLSAV
jgi:hypothetical protein